MVSTSFSNVSKSNFGRTTNQVLKSVAAIKKHLASKHRFLPITKHLKTLTANKPADQETNAIALRAIQSFIKQKDPSKSLSPQHTSRTIDFLAATLSKADTIPANQLKDYLETVAHIFKIMPSAAEKHLPAISMAIINATKINSNHETTNDWHAKKVTRATLCDILKTNVRSNELSSDTKALTFNHLMIMGLDEHSAQNAMQALSNNTHLMHDIELGPSFHRAYNVTAFNITNPAFIKSVCEKEEIDIEIALALTKEEQPIFSQEWQQAFEKALAYYNACLTRNADAMKPNSDQPDAKELCQELLHARLDIGFAIDTYLKADEFPAVIYGTHKIAHPA